MEPTLIKNNKIFNNQKKIIVTLIVFLVCLFIGTSYSILTSTDETEEVITFQAGELNLEVKTNTDTSVNLPNELPKSEEEVETPIILNLKNTGSLTICEYRLKLVADTSPDSPASDLEANYIRYAVSLDNGVSYRGSRLLSETNSQIYIGLDLKPEATKTIYVKVWLDEAALDNEEILNKHFYGKIDAELLQRCETPATEIVKATIGETGGIIGVTNDNQKATEETSNIREYRYSGLGVNNYVTFNDETWRILGVFKGDDGQDHMKIVRNEVLPASVMPDAYTVGEISYKIRPNSATAIAYWDYDGDEQNSDSNWSEAGIMQWLNSTGTENGYLKILTGEAQNMIYEMTWNLGNVSIYSDTAIQAYEEERKVIRCNSNDSNSNERNCYVWPNNQATWKGKIALLYPSDWGFCTDSSNWSTKILNTDYIIISDSSWLYKDANHNDYEWFLSPSSRDYVSVTGVSFEGVTHNNLASYTRAVRPTLYLKSEVTITSGNGSFDQPYKLEFK